MKHIKLANAIMGRQGITKKAGVLDNFKRYLGSMSKNKAIAVGAGSMGAFDAAKDMALLAAMRKTVDPNSIFRVGLSDTNYLSKIPHFNDALKSTGDLLLDPNKAGLAYGLAGGTGLLLGALKGGVLGYGAHRAAAKSYTPTIARAIR
jgi:hypothetical protein